MRVAVWVDTGQDEPVEIVGKRRQIGSRIRQGHIDWIILVGCRIQNLVDKVATGGRRDPLAGVNAAFHENVLFAIFSAANGQRPNWTTIFSRALKCDKLLIRKEVDYCTSRSTCFGFLLFR